MITAFQIQQLYEQRWSKGLAEADARLLLDRRPKASLEAWGKCFADIRAEQEKNYPPSLKTILASMPAELGPCETCGGLRGVTVQGAFVSLEDAQRLGLQNGRDYLRLKFEKVAHLALGAIKQARAHGVEPSMRKWLAWCDDCAGENRPTITECFHPGGGGQRPGRFSGFVRIAQVSPAAPESTRRAADQFVVRVLSRAFQGPSEGRGKSRDEEQITLDQFWTEAKRGELDLRPELETVVSRASSKEEMLKSLGLREA